MLPRLHFHVKISLGISNAVSLLLTHLLHSILNPNSDINRIGHDNIKILIHIPSGQLSKTNCAISEAESSGENRNSLVLPETRISLKLTCKSIYKFYRCCLIIILKGKTIKSSVIEQFQRDSQ